MRGGTPLSEIIRPEAEDKNGTMSLEVRSRDEDDIERGQMTLSQGIGVKAAVKAQRRKLIMANNKGRKLRTMISKTGLGVLMLKGILVSHPMVNLCYILTRI